MSVVVAVMTGNNDSALCAIDHFVGHRNTSMFTGDYGIYQDGYLDELRRKYQKHVGQTKTSIPAFQHVDNVDEETEEELLPTAICVGRCVNFEFDNDLQVDNFLGTPDDEDGDFYLPSAFSLAHQRNLPKSSLERGCMVGGQDIEGESLRF